MADTIKAYGLEGVDLAFWVAVAMGHTPRLCSDGTYVIVACHPFTLDWKTAGMLVDEVDMTISAPQSPVHRNGGRMPGWGPRGDWGACTWVNGKDGRRSFVHASNPCDAIGQCYVMHKLGREFAREIGEQNG